ncbi:MAG: TrmH family RNA methyltransferase [Pirellulales bacterium]
MAEQDITSPHNPRVKQAVRLRDRRQRNVQGRMLIDGAVELSRAMAAGLPVEQVFACREVAHSEASRRTIEQARRTAAELLWIPPAIFEKLAFGQRSDGVLGVAAIPRASLADLVLPALPLVAVLEGCEKPGNLGAVLRSADGAGVSAVIVADGRTDLYNPNAIRASLGTIFTMPVREATSAETMAWLRARGIPMFAARVDGAVPYTAVDLRQPAALLLGSEALGLSSIWSGTGLTAIQLPMRGTADSLNVSATAAILFYEALRQRGG